MCIVGHNMHLRRKMSHFGSVFTLLLYLDAHILKTTNPMRLEIVPICNSTSADTTSRSGDMTVRYPNFTCDATIYLTILRVQKTAWRVDGRPKHVGFIQVRCSESLLVEF
jgi:hypothetical protein